MAEVGVLSAQDECCSLKYDPTFLNGQMSYFTSVFETPLQLSTQMKVRLRKLNC